jgi:hypothetical protein
MSTQDVPTVFIVDDDRDVRESLQELLESVGLHSNSFGTAQEFLSNPRSDGPTRRSHTNTGSHVVRASWASPHL